ncbi:hypothetical protein FGO68_gene3810 [Halteria grandinella]|uniref:Dephospho-CoA kinase n=1 Tax=Halteria grandinella TaxID=5974 RepID=A0A8J8NLS7_HALGN|nr:hypothetical protein FGO68_gene3810 [Halteria grandinella]
MGTNFQCVGLTGGIACGKSTVSGLLAEHGFDIIDADQISRELDNDTDYQNAVRREFGQDVFSVDTGKIDRLKLGHIIFNNPLKRRQLDKISHPRIFRRIFVNLFKLKFIQRKPLVVLDAPLLYESKILEWVCYPIVVVYLDDSQKQVMRMIERARKTNTDLTEEEAMRKISTQMPIGIKIKKADILVDNGGTREDLEKKVIDVSITQIYQRLGYIDKE